MYKSEKAYGVELHLTMTKAFDINGIDYYKYGFAYLVKFHNKTANAFVLNNNRKYRSLNMSKFEGKDVYIGFNNEIIFDESFDETNRVYTREELTKIADSLTKNDYNKNLNKQESETL